MKLTDLQKLKHDTVGKFATLSELIALLDETNLQTPEMQEVIIALDETFQKMAKASAEFSSSVVSK